jgi:hypothetical protein
VVRTSSGCAPLAQAQPEGADGGVFLLGRETLTAFVKYLGKSGQAVVDEGITPSGQPGLFLKYIIRDPELMAKQKYARGH